MNKPSRLLIAPPFLLLVLFAALTQVVAAPLSGSSQPAQTDYNLLANPGLETYDPPYAQYEGIDCQVATGWTRFWHSGAEPYWMDNRVYAHSHLGVGWEEHIEGDTSQMVLSTEPYTAGVYQQVSGLTSGRGYGCHAAMMTIYQTSAGDPVPDKMFKRVGIDPTGGTDAQAPTVVWGEASGQDYGWEVNRRTSAFAQAPTVTVFIEVDSLYPSGGLPLINLGFLDSAILAATPVITAMSPAHSSIPTFTVSWDNVVPAPGFYKMRGVDVQWLDEDEGVWHDWMEGAKRTSTPFVGTPGHTYRFRARVWQKYTNGAKLVSPYRTEGDTRTIVGAPWLVGRVTDHRGRPQSGATVTISGTDYIVTSGSDGTYALQLQPLSGPQTISVSHGSYLLPAPVVERSFGPTETVAITWTLRPLDDAVRNGGFENGLAGWQAAESPHTVTSAPDVVSNSVHTGWGAARIMSQGVFSTSLTLDQTIVLTRAWDPVLSFWYRPVLTDTDDTFAVMVQLITVTHDTALPVTTTRLLTPDHRVANWQHAFFDILPGEAWFTGTMDLGFLLEHDGDSVPATVYVDEVSLGSKLGGPYHVPLPLIFRLAP